MNEKMQNYLYKIWKIDRHDRWIFISSNDRFDCDDPDAFVQLVKAIRAHLGGEIVPVGVWQYGITGDKLHLVYQWDGVFGITVVYPEGVTAEEALDFLKGFITV